jgi:hypothetical protein
LFPKLKPHPKQHNFGTVEEVQAAATRALNNISVEDFLGTVKSGSNDGIAVFDHK